MLEQLDLSLVKQSTSEPEPSEPSISYAEVLPILHSVVGAKSSFPRNGAIHWKSPPTVGGREHTSVKAPGQFMRKIYLYMNSLTDTRNI